jgi:hypothetical protein
MTAATDLSPLQSPIDDDATIERGQSRFLCHVTLAGDSPAERSVVIRIGAKFTTAVRTEGERVVALRIVSHGAVLLAASQAEAASASGTAAARVVRAAARQVAERAQLEILRGAERPVIGAPGIARAVIDLGSSGASRATLEQVHAATDTLGVSWVEQKKDPASRSSIGAMMIGAAMLGAILEYLGAREIEAEPEPPAQPMPASD